MARHVVDDRMRSGRWRLILPGVYLTRPEHSRRDLIDAALLYGGPRSVLSGAEALHTYRLLTQTPDRILVLTTAARRPHAFSWLQVRPTHRLPDACSYGEELPRLAPVARAVADHALTLTYLDDVRAITARAIQRRLCTVAQLRHELEAGPRNGSGHLRDALPDIEAGAWSAPEARAGRALRRQRLGGFEQNAPIRGRSGGTFYVDFLWRKLQAILEIDSRQHHFEQPEWEKTMQRDLELEALGYSVVHMPSPTARTEAHFVAQVQHWLTARATSLGIPFPFP